MSSIMTATVEESARTAIKQGLEGDHTWRWVSTKEDCLAALKRNRVDVLFIDLVLLADQKTDSETAMAQIAAEHPSTALIVLATDDRVREAVLAVRAGAGGYLLHPLDKTEVSLIVDELTESAIRQSELEFLRNRVWKSEALEQSLTNNPAMKAVYEKVKMVAPTNATVLLTGETGTGKGVLARMIHRLSQRADRQLISVHCGAIPETLLESELFGHEKGAFTGAHRRKLGRFEIASEGTIFLDEVATIGLESQIKLLEVLQDGVFTRVGGEANLQTDARVIAAANLDLSQLVEQGKFRQDLYYRLNVFPIHLPPLRERLEDIPLLFEYFRKRLNRRHGKKIADIHPLALDALSRYPWPGNIRELENLIERAFIIETGRVLNPDSFPAEMFTAEPSASTDNKGAVNPPTLAEVRRRAVEEIERRYVRDLLTTHQGRIGRAAAAAGVTPRQLHNILGKYGIHKEDFKR